MFDPATQKYISLATFRKNGREVRTPVWVASVGNRHYVFSEATAGKVKRIRNNGKARLAPCDVRGGLLADTWLDASASIVTDPDEIDQAYRAFDAKYGLIMRITNLLSRLSGRYHNRAILALELTSQPCNLT